MNDEMKSSKKKVTLPKEVRFYRWKVADKLAIYENAGDIRLCPQAQAIAVNFVGRDEVLNDEDMALECSELRDQGKLRTKQDPVRIFKYYRAVFLGAQLLETWTEAVQPEVDETTMEETA